MNVLGPIAMFGWIPLSIALFGLLETRRAIITAFLVGWLFLPQASYAISGLPDYTRMTAVSLGVLLGAVIFDRRGLLACRPRWIDAPILVFCLTPISSSLTNDLGLYDGVSGALRELLTWGIPYWIGRAYFADPRALRMLAVGLFIGGLVYMPMCLWEARMAPTLHYDVYGFSATSFHTNVRLGGYRPRVFLHSGLPLGLWMAITAVTGIVLWRSKALIRLMKLPVGPLAVGLLVTAVLCRSLGALVLLAMAMGTLLLVRQLRLRVALLALFLLPAMYVSARAPQLWNPGVFVGIVEQVDVARAQSFEGRLAQEEELVHQAWKRPLFGSGAWGRNRYNEDGELVRTTDSLWIIMFGQRGLTGLLSLWACFTLPAVLLWRRLRGSDWWSPAFAPATALAVGVTMYACDCLMNAMICPVYHLMIGSLAGYVVHAGRQARMVVSEVRAARLIGAGSRSLEP